MMPIFVDKEMIAPLIRVAWDEQSDICTKTADLLEV
jgi:hypothetical protein